MHLLLWLVHSTSSKTAPGDGHPKISAVGKMTNTTEDKTSSVDLYLLTAEHEENADLFVLPDKVRFVLYAALMRQLL